MRIEGYEEWETEYWGDEIARVEGYDPQRRVYSVLFLEGDRGYEELSSEAYLSAFKDNNKYRVDAVNAGYSSIYEVEKKYECPECETDALIDQNKGEIYCPVCEGKQ